MNDALHDHYESGRREVEEYTTRIIRTYRGAKPDGIFYERLDWEQTRYGETSWRDDQLDKLDHLLRSAIDLKRVRAILVKDLRRGVVSSEIIDWLSRSFGVDSPPWYVSTKRWRPKWFQKLKGLRVELLLVPQVPAQHAIRDNQLSCWLTRRGRIPERAMLLVDQLIRDTRCKRVMVMPDGLSALACDVQTGNCYVQYDKNPEPTTVPMGGASIFFPAMVALMQHQALADQPLGDLLSLALRTTSDWIVSEARRVESPESWNPDPGEWEENRGFKQIRDMFNSSGSLPPIPIFGETATYKWKDELTMWEEARKDLGIVVKGCGAREFHLWRATVEVEGYICCDEGRRRRLRALVSGTQMGAESEHHASCLLVASPGSGKTFLAEQLAKASGMRVLPFNITQMRARSDILECFETVVAAQEESQDERLLVFIDEINAELDESPVYSAFLAPLESGTFVKQGKTFHIRPCVWMFAGTEDPRTTLGGASTKGSDFVSRLSLGIADLRRTGTFADSLENVYLGVSLLRREFPDVRQVSEAVLRAFFMLRSSVRVRDLKHFVRRFKDVQYGRVTHRNVPMTDWPGDTEGTVFLQWDEEVRHAESVAEDERKDRLRRGEALSLAEEDRQRFIKIVER
jgi:hypothetical protein